MHNYIATYIAICILTWIHLIRRAGFASQLASYSYIIAINFDKEC